MWWLFSKGMGLDLEAPHDLLESLALETAIPCRPGHIALALGEQVMDIVGGKFNIQHQKKDLSTLYSIRRSCSLRSPVNGPEMGDGKVSVSKKQAMCHE